MAIGDWQHFSSGYFLGSCNFAIKNLSDESISTSEAVQSYISMLERGLPTKPAHLLLTRLQSDYGIEITSKELETTIPLIGPQHLNWGDVILGDDKSSYYPAREFYEELIERKLLDYGFIKNLIIPECPINWIIPNLASIDELSPSERVDFYLPQAKIVIEIDGQSHNEKLQKIRDKVRDEIFLKANIRVVRIPTAAIKEQGNLLEDALKSLTKILDERSTYLEAYKVFLEDKKYKNKSPIYDLIAVARLQRVIAELIRVGGLSCKSRIWNIEVKSDFGASLPWARLALDDLKISLEAFAKIYGENINIPQVNILSPGAEASTKRNVKIDLCIFKPFDESCSDKNIIFIRNHFIQHHSSLASPETTDSGVVSLKSKHSANINFIDSEKLSALKTISKQVFGYKDFQPGQVNIIQTHFMFLSSLGLLPTGAGKSFCFQISALLRRGCTLVICPITALVRDHVAELNQFGFSGRAAYISAEVKGSERSFVIEKFRRARLRFLFVSPEQMQRQEFRDLINEATTADILSSVVVDEVHCLSEWGHDFRTSYLTLGKAIKKVAPNTSTLSLTATASMRVLKDISIEMEVEEEAICYHMDQSRTELNFYVKTPKDNLEKRSYFRSLIKKMTHQGKADNLNPFLIFTTHVNGALGCSVLIDDVRKIVGDAKVALFSGQEPHPEKTRWSLENDQHHLPHLDWGTINQSSKEERYAKYKSEVQRLFKENKIAGICATKSFGMGVNKPNIRTTIHYGCPQSMEALYQEAGRAGRDRQNSNCYILFNSEKNLPNNILTQSATLEDLYNWRQSLSKSSRGDFSQQLYFLTNGLKNISDETDDCQRLLANFRTTAKSQQTLGGKGKSRLEKTIYRLYQLGFVTDWTVDDFFRGTYTVDWLDQNTLSLATRLKGMISKYADSPEEGFQHTSRIDEILSTKKDSPSTERQLISYLLQWNYDHFVYNRRQSLKNIYEACEAFSDGREEEFRKKLESYFSVKIANRIENIISAQITEVPASVIAILRDSNGYLKDNDAIITLNASIARYLENYQNNPGLNLLSAMCRAILMDFDNADGRDRLLSFLNLASDSNLLEKLWPQLLKLLKIFPNQVTEEICHELIAFDLGMDKEIDLFEMFGLTIAAQKAVERMNRTLRGVL